MKKARTRRALNVSPRNVRYSEQLARRSTWKLSIARCAQMILLTISVRRGSTEPITVSFEEAQDEPNLIAAYPRALSNSSSSSVNLARWSARSPEASASSIQCAA